MDAPKLFALLSLMLLFGCASQGTGKMTVEEAMNIAKNSDCMKQGNLDGTSFYNENSKTWWFGLDTKKPGCSPACMVWEENRSAEINWRCTGLAPPPGEHITNITCDVKKPCPTGLECYSFPEKEGPRCSDPDPCTNYYVCPEGKKCMVLESFPMQIRCG
jgi:hypothetical protein